MVTTRSYKRGKTPSKKVVRKAPAKQAKMIGGLYPTIAISDLFNGIAHLYAGSLVENDIASLGFYIVACASLVGTMRFGFSESLFSKMNAGLARYAAYVGLPLIGLSTWDPESYHAKLPSDGTLIVGYSLFYIMAESLPEELEKILPVLVNLCFFCRPSRNGCA